MVNIGDAAHSRGDVMRRLTDLEALVRELVAGRRLENAAVGAGGIRIHGGGGLRVHEGGGIDIEDGGDIDVTEGGDINLSGGGGLTVEDGGDIRVNDGGNIDVSEGSLRILNAAGGFLANVVPVAFDLVGATETNYSITTTHTTRASANLTVPSWVDEALVIVSANHQGVNSRAVIDYMTISVIVDGDELGFYSCEAEAGPGRFAGGSITDGKIVTNPGPTIPVGGRVWTVGGTWTANASTGCSMNAFAIYRRAS